MKCSNCGNELVPGSRFCDSCGAPVEEKPAFQPPPPSPTPGPGSPLPPPSFETPKQSFFSTIQQGNQVAGIDRGILAIASLVVGVLSLCGALIPCIGCPMLIIGAALGFLGLKSEKRIFAIIGLILAGVALLIAIGAGAIGLFSYLSSSSSGYY